jgi:hypothetical protein
MAIIHGDTVIPAGAFNSVVGVADLSVGSLCPAGLNIGTYHGGAPSDEIVWNNGTSSVSGTAVNPRVLRKCTAYTGLNLLGKTVQLIGKATAFRGPVVQQLDTELDGTEGTGTQVPILVIKGAGFFFVAEPASVGVV